MNTKSFSKQIANYESFLLVDYKLKTIKQYSKIVLDYLKWQDANIISKPACLKSSIGEYINFNSSCNKNIKTIRAAMHLYYYHTTGIKFQTSQHKVLNKSVENAVDEYAEFLDNIAGLAAATRISHTRYLQQFLSYVFLKQAIEPLNISVAMVQNFFANEIRHLKPASKKVVIGIIRSYIRYLKFKGVEIDSGLLALPLSAPVWKLSGVPKTFDQKDIDKILASYNLNTLVGIRDYAIALCFTELALRASEVANITIDDLNWRKGTIQINKTKTHRERELPLPRNVGEAIVKYLKSVDTERAGRTLFVRFSHCCGDAMGREQIRGTVRRAYARSGMPFTITGTHILRHSKAKSMYENGSSLKIIADILGHGSIDTTVIYTKVGRSELHPVTCPWLATVKPEVDHE